MATTTERYVPPLPRLRLKKLTCFDVARVSRWLCSQDNPSPKAIIMTLLTIRRDQEQAGLLDEEVRRHLDRRIAILREMVAPALSIDPST